MDLSEFAADLSVFYDTPVLLFKKAAAPSDYIGTAYTWQPQGTVMCGVQPVTDKLTLEQYGPRIQNMRSLHMAPGTGISDDVGVAFTVGATEPEYKVVSVFPRQTHTRVLVEVIGVGS